MLVPHLTFGDLGQFERYVFCNICLEHVFVKSCFQQSAKDKTTAQTNNKNNVFNTLLNFTIGFPSKVSTFRVPPLCLLCLVNSLQRRYVSSRHGIKRSTLTLRNCHRLETNISCIFKGNASYG